MTDEDFLRIALDEARAAALAGDVPVGACVVRDGVVLARDRNRREETEDPTAHAERLAITAAAQRLGTWRLEGCTLYVTLEPCAMCAAAISFARIRRVIFGALDAKGGGVFHGGKFYDQPTCHHRPEIRHLDTPQASQILKDYFKNKR